MSNFDSIACRNGDVSRYFGESVFNDKAMRTRLSTPTYHSLKATIEEGAPLNQAIAAEVAVAMKEWAIEKGATHYTHWFQPMTGSTAEKQDAFIDNLRSGEIIMNFSGKALIKGEPDASSFPTGGLRETAAARGYTSWDCTSPAFVKDSCLYIPTAFYSYTGEVLDYKAPLLRSNQSLSNQAMRVLRALGNTRSKRVQSNIGPEQEYFLVDLEKYESRPDLIETGRTLFGCPPAHGAELSDHYYASIHTRVLNFMQELDRELWIHGITAKTRHNEVAPTQHELALIFDPASVAVDHNMLVMEMMKKIAPKYGFVCLLNEKPYKDFSASGKHINWSIGTDDGINLLAPQEGVEISEDLRFLLFISSVIAAADRFAEYLLLSVATAGNERRLGTHEAPPSILSLAIGEELEDILFSIRDEKIYVSKGRVSTNLGVDSMSVSTVDTTDRNRTSPLAYTGNRFEFRLGGSQINVSGPAFVINTIVAKQLSEIADVLEKADNVEEAAKAEIKRLMTQHSRVLYHGDNYLSEWPKEAKRRGLTQIGSAPEAIVKMRSKNFIELFDEMGVLTKEESLARCEARLENYYNVIGIEAHTAVDMFNKLYAPAIMRQMTESAENITLMEGLGIENPAAKNELEKLNRIYNLCMEREEALVSAYERAMKKSDLYEKALAFHELAFKEMDELRAAVDSAELIVADDLWPVPSYRELLYQHK